MIINEEDLKQILSDAFDAGFRSPFEMMDQEVESLLTAIKAKIPAVASTDNWMWGDYLHAIESPDPWVKAAAT